MKSILILLCVLCVSGCALSTPQAPTDPASYGRPVARADAESAAKLWLDAHLRDPSSTQIQWMGLDRFFSFNGFNETFVGYGLDAEINSANGFGGMTGSQPYTFVFYDGELTHVFGMKYQPTFRRRLRSRLWSRE